jgi:hypothetical protein
MHSLGEGFKEWQENIELRARQMYRELALHNIRIFCLSLRKDGRCERQYWLHDGKSVSEWRQDIRFFMENGDMQDDEGYADDSVYNALGNHLRELGYAEVHDVVVDVFEGRVTNHSAKLTHDPAHDEQPDGFGHYGWENHQKPPQQSG